MGIGKTIRGLGVSELYHPDPTVFGSRVAETFKVNVNRLYIDGEEQDGHARNIPYEKSITLHACSCPKKQFIYEFNLPVNHPREKTLDFTFYPNHIFDLIHIPYSSVWRFLLEEISGSYGGLNKLLPHYLDVKKLYTAPIRSLNTNKLIIITHANYLWEDELLTFENYEEKYVFEDLKGRLEYLDGIQFLNLHEVFSGQHTYEIKKVYEAEGYYSIAFIDDLSETILDYP